MAVHQLKVVVVGASSLLGKELNEELLDSPLAGANILLADSEAAEGQIMTVGDEPSFIQRVGADSFLGADFVFFAGSQEQTLEHWNAARQAGATVVDLSGALSGEAEVLTWSPWLATLRPTSGTPSKTFTAGRPDLQTTALVAAHPAATMLALVAAKLTLALQKPNILAATVLQPASELGSPGMDELHQQTVSLLSFKELPKEVFDAQVAFNIIPTFGDEAKSSLARNREMILEQYAALSNDQLPSLSLYLLQSPVFHGYTASVFLDFSIPTTLEDLRAAIDGDHLALEGAETDVPNNLSAAGRKDILVQAGDAGRTETGSQFWLWIAADNLKLAAVNAIDCALAMRALRPQGKVQ